MKKTVWVIIVMSMILSNQALPQDSLNVRMVSIWPNYWQVVNEVAIADTLAFVSTGQSGLRIVDVSDPLNSDEIGWFDTPGTAISAVISGCYAYVADGDSGLRVIDFSNPRLPVEVSSLEIFREATFIAVSDTLAYISGNGGGLRTINISDPLSPHELGFWYSPSPISDIISDGNTLYLATGNSGLRILDVSDPGQPIETGNLFFQEGLVDKIAKHGIYVYATDNSVGVRVLDVSDSAHPAELSIQGGFLAPHDVQIRDELLFVADWENGVRIFDISDPTLLNEIGVCSTSGASSGICLSEEYAYIADSWSGLRIFDVSDPTLPIGVGSTMISMLNATDIDAANGIVMIGEWGGIRIVDVSHPTSISELSVCDSIGAALEITIADSQTYVSGSGLWILDTSNPEQPIVTGHCNLPASPEEIAVSGDYSYVAANTGGLYITDVANPANPFLVAQYDNAYLDGLDVAVQGSYVYLAALSQGIRIISVANPYTAFEAGAYDSPGNIIHSVELVGELAFLADGATGLRVVDVSTPSSTVAIGICPLDHGAEDLKIVGNNAYIMSNQRLQVIDISDSTSPFVTGYYDLNRILGGSPLGFAVWNSYAFITDGQLLYCFDCSDATNMNNTSKGFVPQAITLNPAYPNPFNPTATIQFELPVASDVTLTVYNIAGQMVETLVAGSMTPGSHVVAFDGSRFSSGSYFYTLKTGSFSETRKMILVK